MRYFKYKNINKTQSNALKAQYATLTKDEKRTARRKNFWTRCAGSVGVFMFIACFGGCIKLITLIPVPTNIVLKILYCLGVALLGFASLFIGGGLTFLSVLPFSKMAGKYTMPEMKRKIFSEACSHLRAYYGLQEPYILTKCFDSSDQNFVNHDVCIFVAGDELRITADLKNGFLYGERDLGCYAFRAEEILLSKKQEAGRLIVELKAEGVVFLLGYRAKSFIQKNYLSIG